MPFRPGVSARGQRRGSSGPGNELAPDHGGGHRLTPFNGATAAPGQHHVSRDVASAGRGSLGSGRLVAQVTEG